jgi:hypothetical protein
MILSLISAIFAAAAIAAAAAAIAGRPAVLMRRYDM